MRKEEALKKLETRIKLLLTIKKRFEIPDKKTLREIKNYSPYRN